ncbi:hypothetical protein HYH02_001739 [Chlamydomonas schloesseri]|uniref:Serine aminopeptidase S33 domain-containing protein n=1 Tax=Chlamydomonas schloesseri TaxID=2026947 RepID=A0A836BC70_9CHLO|nr:hypothetical protein HYH02_001739 [Chlamydomonas schloesseri]|eukprot:KAG2453519.1 hypothetical protein HYH02_001739 [Chlamydomonas schloesseri]
MVTALAVALLGAAIAFLATLPYEAELLHTTLARNTSLTPDARPLTPGVSPDGLPYGRSTLHFNSSGTACEAWLYTPAKWAAAGPLPVVIMAHGLGAQKDLGLHRYADAFARAGLAALLFDYRTFGGSDGEPRHWVSPRRHVEDWRAAVDFVKGGGLGPQYDTERVSLWGTSFAGGHVLVTAADLPPGAVKSIVAMVPFLDGIESAKANLRARGLPGVLRLLAAAAHDKLRAAAATALDRLGSALAPPNTDSTTATGKAQAAASAAAADSPAAAVERLLAALRPAAADAVSRLREAAAPLLTPAYVKLLGAPGELALMQLQPAEIAAYFAKHPKEYQGGWRPLVLARVGLETSSYRPTKSLERLAGLPLLFVSAAEDSLCPAALVRAAAEAAAVAAAPGGGAEYLELPCDHFSAYSGEHLEVASARMVTFLRKHFGLDEGGSAAASAQGHEAKSQREEAGAPDEARGSGADAGAAPAAQRSLEVETVEEGAGGASAREGVDENAEAAPKVEGA